MTFSTSFPHLVYINHLFKRITTCVKYAQTKENDTFPLQDISTQYTINISKKLGTTIITNNIYY